MIFAGALEDAWAPPAFFLSISLSLSLSDLDCVDL